MQVPSWSCKTLTDTGHSPALEDGRSATAAAEAMGKQRRWTQADLVPMSKAAEGAMHLVHATPLAGDEDFLFADR